MADVTARSLQYEYKAVRGGSRRIGFRAGWGGGGWEGGFGLKAEEDHEGAGRSDL